MKLLLYSYFIPIIILVLFYRKYTTANFDAFLWILRIPLDPQKDVPPFISFKLQQNEILHK